jgi:hypothetical protein
MTVFPTLSAIPVNTRSYAAAAATPLNVTPPSTSETAQPPAPCIQPIDKNSLWHRRFLHASADRVAVHIRNHQRVTCEPCSLGKTPRKLFKPVDDKATNKLEIVHIDHCGPVNPTTYGGGKYALNLRDEATSYTWTYIVPDKTAKSIIEVLKVWKPMVENQAGTNLQIIRTDDAEEFKSAHAQYLQQFGVLIETTAGYSSSSNRAVERVHRTLFDMVRPMLIHSNLPTPFWGEAISTAAKVLNRLPTKANAKGICPHEAWFGKKPSIKHLQVFGCVAKVTLPIEIIGKGNKPAPRAIKCCLLGYQGN